MVETYVENVQMLFTTLRGSANQSVRKGQRKTNLTYNHVGHEDALFVVGRQRKVWNRRDLGESSLAEFGTGLPGPCVDVNRRRTLNGVNAQRSTTGHEIHQALMGHP